MTSGEWSENKTESAANYESELTFARFIIGICVLQELVECLKDLEHICPSPEDFRGLCALLTLPKLSDHVDFKNWNPSSARVECFRKVCITTQIYFIPNVFLFRATRSRVSCSFLRSLCVSQRKLSHVTWHSFIL